MITYLIFLLAGLTNGQTYQRQYSGAVKISGTIINGGVNLVDNKYKQHQLFKRSIEWLRSEFGSEVKFTMSSDTLITYEDTDYKLELYFKDGVYKFVFSDDGKYSQTKQQELIDRLTTWIKTKPLVDKTW
jgi:hypothetical protein